MGLVVDGASVGIGVVGNILGRGDISDGAQVVGALMPIVGLKVFGGNEGLFSDGCIVGNLVQPQERLHASNAKRPSSPIRSAHLWEANDPIQSQFLDGSPALNQD